LHLGFVLSKNRPNQQSSKIIALFFDSTTSRVIKLGFEKFLRSKINPDKSYRLNTA